MTGTTASSNFPITSGAYDDSYYPYCYDSFITKLNNNLTAIDASTFLGGNDCEYPSFIKIDGSGDVYVTGQTYSANYPTTSSAYDESYNGGIDVFISKLSNNLTSLESSSFIGGNNVDVGVSIALAGNHVYMAGQTSSSDFPITSGAYDESYNGGAGFGDAFVSKLSDNLTTLEASTFVGGTGDDASYKIALDGSENAYVIGIANSSDFPTTSGAYDESPNGDYDAFVIKLDSSLNNLTASTFLGGSGNDHGASMALDANYVYITGSTQSPDFPITSGAYDITYNGNGDGFVSKLNKNLSADDNDGIPYPPDNCPDTPNGPLLGTCTNGATGDTCNSNVECGIGGFCSMNQEDRDKDGIGDVCDDTTMCKGNFDYDKDVDGTDASLFKLHFGRSALKDPCPSDGPAPVEKTWQTTPYASYDDGYYQKGVVWPAPRFVDNANGTVTDKLTGLIWLKNANCFGARTWSQALADCNGLANGSCGLSDGSSAGDWRLPNRDELNSLIDINYSYPALSNTAGTGQWEEGNPFTNLVIGNYWSSSNHLLEPVGAWHVHTSLGDVYGSDKSYLYHTWPVRGGH